MVKVDTTTAALTRKRSTPWVEGGILPLSLRTRCPSYSHPDGSETTTGNWPERQTAVSRVVKVRSRVAVAHMPGGFKILHSLERMSQIE